MSIVRIFLIIFGVMSMITGCRFASRSRQRLADKHVASQGVVFGITACFFGAAIILLATIINVSGWSVLDWIGGIFAAAVVYSAGIPLGVLVEILSRKSNNGPQRTSSGFFSR